MSRPASGSVVPTAPRVPPATETERRAERLVALCFVVTMLSGGALLVLYVLGGQTQLEGLLLTACLGSLGAGIVLWSHDLMPVRVIVEERKPLGADPRVRQELVEALADESGFTRRRLLVGLLLGAFGGLAAALAIPVLSLGPAPGDTLKRTAWRSGSRVVGVGGEPLRAEDLPIGSIATVFPEDAVGSADAQTLLIHVEPGELQLDERGTAWAPEGFVAYSKVCTHAGCPVGLYRAETHQLVCPCHQSTFDVLRGAVPTYGPAARPLPQLPIQLQPDGTFIALADFEEPVGPGFWDMRL